MTVAQYNKLSKEEQFNCHALKFLNNIEFTSEDNQIINLKTSSDIIIKELNAIGIPTEDKTLDEIFESLLIKSNQINNLVFFNSSKEIVQLNDKLIFFKKYTAFLTLY